MVIALVLGLVLGVTASPSWATFSGSDTATATYSTGTLAAPAAPATAAGTCSVLASDRVVVSWTATSTASADGYEIARSTSAAGPFSVIGTVSGRTTTSYDDGPFAFDTTYHYVVRATENAWRSADTAVVSRTTRNTLCL